MEFGLWGGVRECQGQRGELRYPIGSRYVFHWISSWMLDYLGLNILNRADLFNSIILHVSRDFRDTSHLAQNDQMSPRR